MDNNRPFHLAIPVLDLKETRSFYRNILGCEEGRSSDYWVDFNFYGHQLVIHLFENKSESLTNPVDGRKVPIPHFGVILDWSTWESLAERLKSHLVNFEIAPYIRFAGQNGEQATMFFRDPSGNALEFKAFKDDSRIFAK